MNTPKAAAKFYKRIYVNTLQFDNFNTIHGYVEYNESSSEQYLSITEHEATLAALEERLRVAKEALSKIRSGNDPSENLVYRFSRVDLIAIADIALAEIEK